MNVETTDTATLGLRSILIDSLPSELLTDTAPVRYTVEAVFNRRPAKDEMEEILSSSTHAFLAARGFTEALLEISDRRLNILNTTLEELRDGLAAALADRLADISGESSRKQEASALLFKQHTENERRRIEAVTELARSVTFVGSDDPQRLVTAQDSARADHEEIKNWLDEGGSNRA